MFNIQLYKRNQDALFTARNIHRFESLKSFKNAFKNKNYLWWLVQLQLWVRQRLSSRLPPSLKPTKQQKKLTERQHLRAKPHTPHPSPGACQQSPLHQDTSENTPPFSPNEPLSLRPVFDRTCHHAFCRQPIEKGILYHLNLVWVNFE